MPLTALYLWFKDFLLSGNDLEGSGMPADGSSHQSSSELEHWSRKQQAAGGICWILAIVGGGTRL